MFEFLPTEIEAKIFSYFSNQNSFELYEIDYYKKYFFNNVLKYIDRKRLMELINSKFMDIYDASHKYKVGNKYCYAFYYIFINKNCRILYSNGRNVRFRQDSIPIGIYYKSNDMYVSKIHSKPNKYNKYTNKQKKFLNILCKILGSV